MHKGINLVGESSAVFAARVDTIALIGSVNFVRRLFCRPKCLLIVLVIHVSYIEDVFPFPASSWDETITTTCEISGGTRLQFH
jgi:hypothetical protein